MLRYVIFIYVTSGQVILVTLAYFHSTVIQNCRGHASKSLEEFVATTTPRSEPPM